MKPVNVFSTVAEWPRDVWLTKINGFRREMTGRTNLGKRNERSRYKKSALIELKALEVRHFLNKWKVKCNKDKLGATTDKM